MTVGKNHIQLCVCIVFFVYAACQLTLASPS